MDWCFLLFVLSAVFFSSFRVSDGAALGTTSRASSLTHCGMDYECSDGFYCYKAYQTQICAPCVDCAGYNRLPGFRDCARSKLECGNCVPGYHPLGDRCSTVPDNFTEQEELTTKDKLAKPPRQDPTDFSWWATTVTVLSLVTMVAVIIAGFLLWRKKIKRQQSSGPQEPVKFTDEPPMDFQCGHHHYQPTAPPPYNQLPQDSFPVSTPSPEGTKAVFMGETTAIVIDATQKTNPVSRPDVSGGQQAEQQENGQEHENDDGDGDDGNDPEALEAPAVLFLEAHDLHQYVPNNDGAAQNNENNNDPGIVPMEDEGWEDEQDLDLPEHSFNLADDGAAIVPEFSPQDQHFDHPNDNIFPENQHNSHAAMDEDQSFFQLDMQFALRFVNNTDEQDGRTIAVFRARNDSGLGDSPLRQSYDRLVPDLDNSIRDTADFPSTSTPRHYFSQGNYQGIYESSVNSTLFRALDFLVNSFSDFSRDELPMDEEFSTNLA